MGNWLLCRNTAPLACTTLFRRFVLSAQVAYRLCAVLFAIVIFTSTVATAHAQSRLRGERFPETRLRYLRARDMDKYSNSDLQYAINEMFARRQYLFETASLERFFLQFSWYRPRPELTLTNCVQRMTATERNNYYLLLATLRARRNAGGGGGSTTAYRFPQTRTRNMTQREIEALSDTDLRYALNEVYARHGYRFRTDSTYRLFLRQSWYRPVSGQSKTTTERKFNNYEIRNVRALNDELDYRNGGDGSL